MGDITYIDTDEGWLYLAEVMDLASWRIVGWSMSERMKAELVCDAVKSAYWRRKSPAGVLMHTDRRNQCASERHPRLLGDYQMVQSMSRKENCWYNSAMAGFFKTLKVELVYPQRYATRA